MWKSHGSSSSGSALLLLGGHFYLKIINGANKYKHDPRNKHTYWLKMYWRSCKPRALVRKYEWEQKNRSIFRQPLEMGDQISAEIQMDGWWVPGRMHACVWLRVCACVSFTGSWCGCGGVWGVALQRDYPVCWEIEGAGGRFYFLRGSQIHS